MANNNRCGCNGRRNVNNGYGCLGCLSRRCRWEGFPYYTGPCPDADGGYDCEADREEKYCRDECCWRRRCRGNGCCGVFTAMLPMAVAANGILPLVCGNGMTDERFAVNSGLVTVEEPGLYLATYTVRMPEGAEVTSMLTLNVNDASQSSAITEVGGEGPAAFTAQAVVDVNDRSTIALRTSEAINLTMTSPQPLVTLTLTKIS